MKISYNWLKELLPDLTLTPEQVADALTLHSFETVIDHTFSLDEHIQVVEILKVEPHPNADRLRLATVTNGKEEIKVVCGAPNIAVGQKVPYSSPGAKVLDKDGQLFELTIAKIRGVESPGMLNSRRELGLGSDHDGIFVLPADTPLGSKLLQHIPADTIFEADITPNRAHDCLCHLGVARELAAITGLKVAEPAIANLPDPQAEVASYKLGSIDAATTPRYMSIVVSGMQNTASPLWLQSRLMMLGQKPINALVDMTNYVMFEVGNPNHAFDAKKVPGKTIATRLAKENETLELLDKTTPTLPTNSLIITADDKPIAIAGIMGGKGGEVDESTSEVVLEIANFEPYTIQKTALGLNLRTEAAARFLKGIDPNKVTLAAERLTYLVKEIIGGKVEGVLDFYPNPFEPKPIEFHPAKVSKIAGTDISNEQSKQALEAVRCKVEENGDTWVVTPPSDRLDVTGEHDLVEEVIFQTGLDKVPANPTSEDPNPVVPTVFVREKIKDFLVQENLTETYNYSFENAVTAAMINIPPDHHLHITNPMAPELATLRTSLLPGLIANMIKNKTSIERKNTVTERGLFEIGHVFYAMESTGEGQAVAAISVLPVSETLKKLLAYLNVPGITIEEAKDNKFIKGNQVITLNGQRLSWMGQIQPAIAQKTKYRLPLYAFEMNLEAVLPHIPAGDQAVPTLAETLAEKEPVQYQELSKYPSVYRDITVLVDAETSIEKIKGTIETAGGEYVIDTELFDEYEPDDEGISNERKKKSISFHIEYNATDRTLNEEEINAIQHKIIEALKEEVNGEVN